LNNERGRLFYGGYGGPPEKIPHVFSYIFFFHGGEFVVGETGDCRCLVAVVEISGCVGEDF